MILRTLIADDSALFRKIMSEALASIPNIEIVGTANNGKMALKKIQELEPDLIP